MRSPPPTKATAVTVASLLALSGYAVSACSPGSFDQLEGAAHGAAGTSPGAAGTVAPSHDDASVGPHRQPDSATPVPPQRDAMTPDRGDAGAVSGEDASSSGGDPPGTDTPDGAAAEDSGTGASDARVVEDAAMPDAGPVVPVVPIGESACYTWLADRLVCEGFETTPRDPPWWTIEQSGELTHTGARTHVGIGAIAARSLVSGGNAFVGRVAYPNLTEGTIYLRSYVYVPSGVPLQGVIVHGLSEERAPYGGVSIRLEDTGVSLDLHPRGPGVTPLFITAAPAIALPRDQWNCLQLQLTISASQGSVRLTVNGQVAAASTGPLATLPASGYRGVSAGIVYSVPDQLPVQLFVDEVVADTAPIPCTLAVRDDGVAGGKAPPPTHEPDAVGR